VAELAEGDRVELPGLRGTLVLVGEYNCVVQLDDGWYYTCHADNLRRVEGEGTPP
jgi:hypothetical protein